MGSISTEKGTQSTQSVITPDLLIERRGDIPLYPSKLEIDFLLSLPKNFLGKKFRIL